jgi:hypothetical protein
LKIFDPQDGNLMRQGKILIEIEKLKKMLIIMIKKKKLLNHSPAKLVQCIFLKLG